MDQGPARREEVAESGQVETEAARRPLRGRPQPRKKITTRLPGGTTPSGQHATHGIARPQGELSPGFQGDGKVLNELSGHIIESRRCQAATSTGAEYLPTHLLPDTPYGKEGIWQ